MEKKNEGNENKITLGDFNCTMNKMERDGRNKTLYKCHFNYALWKLILDNGLIPLGLPATIDLLAQDLQ